MKKKMLFALCIVGLIIGAVSIAITKNGIIASVIAVVLLLMWARSDNK